MKENHDTQNLADGTAFTIQKLNPTDTATITFTSVKNSPSYNLTESSSRYNHVSEPITQNFWWDFELIQWGFIIFLSVLGLVIGYITAKILRHPKHK